MGSICRYRQNGSANVIWGGGGRGGEGGKPLITVLHDTAQPHLMVAVGRFPARPLCSWRYSVPYPPLVPLHGRSVPHGAMSVGHCNGSRDPDQPRPWG